MMQVIVATERASQKPSSRDRMVASAAMLIREKGLTGTSFGDVIDHSGAPRGSIYHHFPGGKTQLVEDAVRYAGEYIVGTIDRAAEDGDPVKVLRAFTAAWRRVLEDSDFRAGCPVVAVAVEAHEDESTLTRRRVRRIRALARVARRTAACAIGARGALAPPRDDDGRRDRGRRRPLPRDAQRSAAE